MYAKTYMYVYKELHIIILKKVILNKKPVDFFPASQSVAKYCIAIVMRFPIAF